MIGAPPLVPSWQAARFGIIVALVLLIVVLLIQHWVQKKWFSGLSAKFRIKTKYLVLLLNLLLIIFFFAILELALQIYVHYCPYTVFQPDTELTWKTQKEANFFERPGEKPDRLFRIVCLGDSRTAGNSEFLGETQGYPPLLEKRLKEMFPGASIEVLNGGVPGYSSFQGLILLKKKIIQLKPNLILLSYDYHDSNFAYAPDKEVLTDNKMIKIIRQYFYKSQVYLLLRSLIIKGKIKYSFDRRPIMYRVDVMDYGANLESFISIGKKKGFRVALVFLPIAPEHYIRMAAYRDKMKEVAEKNNCFYINLDDMVTESGEEIRSKLLKKDRVHYTKFGEQWIADRLAEGTGEEGRIEGIGNQELGIPGSIIMGGSD